MPYKRSEWNDLLSEINTSISNRPSGCPSVEPLELLPPNSIWKRSHVTTVQDRLKESCASIAFEPLRPLWHNATVEEIRSKIAQMWCDCSDEDCPPEDEQLNYATFILGGYDWQVLCEDDPQPPIEISIADLVVAPVGRFNYAWRLEVADISTGGEVGEDTEWSSPPGTGPINGGVGCDGKPKVADAPAEPFFMQQPVCYWNCPSGTGQEAACHEAVDGLTRILRLHARRSASGSPCCT